MKHVNWMLPLGNDLSGTLPNPRVRDTANQVISRQVFGQRAQSGTILRNPSYSPGSFTVATEQYAIISRHLKLKATQRGRLVGTATLRIT